MVPHEATVGLPLRTVERANEKDRRMVYKALLAGSARTTLARLTNRLMALSEAFRREIDDL